MKKLFIAAAFCVLSSSAFAQSATTNPGPSQPPCAYVDCTVSSLNVTGSTAPANGFNLVSAGAVGFFTGNVQRVFVTRIKG